MSLEVPCGLVLAGHWINAGRYPAALFTDHKNLLAFFSDKARPASCSRPNRDRLTRWGLRLAGLQYEIFHIDGTENRVADLGSRWGNRYATRKTESKGLHGGPKPLMLRVLRTKPPAVSDVIRRPDQDLPPDGLLPINPLTVKRADLAAVQQKAAATRPANVRLRPEVPQLWQDADRRVWIPDGARRMKRLLYALAHQGVAGHRGQKATMRNLKSRFFWAGMEQEAEGWRKHCLQCLKAASGDTVPRPLGSQLLAERPGEIVSADFIKMGTSRSGYSYVLMVVCRFSRLVMFLPAVSATAVFATRGLLKWASHHGLPEWLISDGGSHFRNSIMEEMTAMLGIRHHITLAYCPWANGSVEVVGHDLVFTCRTLTSEFRANVDEWDLVLGLIEFTANNRERDVLGKRSAIEVMTGQPPTTTVNLALWAGAKLKDARKFEAKTALVEKHCARLEVSLHRLHEAVKDEQEAALRRKMLRAANKQPVMDFNTGDYVLVTASGNQANPTSNHKVNMLWQGPYEVVGGDGPAHHEVRLLGDTTTATVHWRKLVRLAGPDYEPTAEDIASALHDRQRFEVESLDDWQQDAGRVEVLYAAFVGIRFSIIF
ncbi:MAG: hypothetical protein CL915_10755 [Deltaproteobacteria bacterium]|nr:hypothetical protein [Deltaproteobacteria bacterium]